MSRSESFARSGFARFINSTAGRVLRIIVGAVMVIWGALNAADTSGIVVLVIGCIPLIAGAMDLCLVSALLGGPLSGRRVREVASRP